VFIGSNDIEEATTATYGPIIKRTMFLYESGERTKKKYYST